MIAAVHRRQVQEFSQRAKPVTARLGNEDRGQSQGIHAPVAETQPRLAQESQVKLDVVADDDVIGQPVSQRRPERIQRRRFGHHLVGNRGQLRDEGRNLA